VINAKPVQGADLCYTMRVSDWSDIQRHPPMTMAEAAEECMPIYVYRCKCGVRFELLARMDTPAPECPECGDDVHKMHAGFSLGGQVNAGLSRDQMPQTWRGLYHGDPEYVTRMQRHWDHRQQLEAKHPELAGDSRPILAHEGRYHKAPLRAGDPLLGEHLSGEHRPGTVSASTSTPSSD
jgi:putative FmdB family regulatory protein